MMVFDPLWETMKNENVSVYALIHKYGISRGTIDNLKHNRNVTLATIENILQSSGTGMFYILNIGGHIYGSRNQRIT